MGSTFKTISFIQILLEKGADDYSAYFICVLAVSWPDGDRFARDRFYLWLLERIDRWDEWSEMVSRDGARALTEHFMKLAFCDRFVAEGFAGFDGL